MEHTQTKFSNESAGKAMTKNFPLLQGKSTVYNALSYLTKKAHQLETVDCVFVSDETGKLKGAVPIKSLLQNAQDQGEKTLKSIMLKNPPTVKSKESQERAAHLALEHNVEVIPVVNGKNEILGVIPNQKLLSIMYHEKVEDLLKFAGVIQDQEGIDDVMSLSLGKSIAKRFPWLLLGTGGGILMAETITYFENTLEKNLLLAAFIPLIVYMSNAVGQQISAFIIRDSAHRPSLNYTRYFLKHLLVVLGAGLLLGLVIGIYGQISYGDVNLSLILSLSVFATIFSAIFSGFLIPYFFIKIRKDPANGSGPISTIIQDVLSVIIYFVIASALI